ncbi:MAG: hypothetical protein P1V18_01790 [Candidatus Gracilibacteria bacterium]|nr:hypothetical protein [Candidatus Gracilibacteria bacterium]
MDKLLRLFSEMIRATTGLVSYQETGEIPIDSIAYQSRDAFKNIGVL